MSITYHERPGVYSDYTVQSVSANGSTEKTVALIGVSTAAAGLYHVTAWEDAKSVFGESSGLGRMVKAAFENGAGEVLAYSLTSETSAGYAAAFEAVFREKKASYCAIASTDAAIQGQMKTAIINAAAQKAECIGVVTMASATKAGLLTRAEGLNCERMVLLGPNLYANGETVAADGGTVAAAFCGMLAKEDDPSLPVNGVALQGFCGVTESYGDTDLDALVRGGVTVLECADGKVCVVRGITTKKTVGEGCDTTYRELNVVRVIDDVVPAIRKNLGAKFTRAKNNAVTRGAIRSQVIVELEDRIRREIIDGYESVTVQPSAGDATVCVVSFGFTVTHGLNRIHLTAQITV